MRINIQNLIVMIGFMLTTSLHAADSNNGKNLVNTHCTQCHIRISGGDGSGIYTRQDRRVTSLPGLIKQVERCKTSTGAPWSDQQSADAVAYLNSAYYHFQSGQ